MVTSPNYLDVQLGSEGLLPHIQKVNDDGDIDAAIVRGGFERLSADSQQIISQGPTIDKYHWDNIDRAFGSTLIGLVVPDLEEVRAYYEEIAAAVMPDFKIEKDSDILGVDDVRGPGVKSYAHVDLPVGIFRRDGYEAIRAVSSLSIGAGTGSAVFLVKRLRSFSDANDLYHEFIGDYLDADTREIEDGMFIHQEGWAIVQHPGDTVIIPQFDRPTIHQVAPDDDRSSVVYSTFITSYYEAYNQSPEGIAHPYVPKSAVK